MSRAGWAEARGRLDPIRGGRAVPGGAEPADPEDIGHRPLYARMLRLRHLAPSGVLCFVFLEGAIALGILLALAELVSWWGVIVLPVTVAAMVKLNDVIAGLLARSAAPARPVAARAAVLRPAASGGLRTAHIGEESTTRLSGPKRHGALSVPPGGQRLETHQQWVRQSATRRYE
jgi:predicted secreted protein